MIRIFNNKLNKVILIDDENEIVAYIPKLYDEENPHVLIELKGIDFFRHSKKCEDCKAFVDALGSNSHDWYIDMNGKVERLNLFGLGKKYTDNKAAVISSYFFDGTKLKLNIDNDTIEGLKIELKELEQSEQYEECCFLRDKIKAISDEEKSV